MLFFITKIESLFSIIRGAYHPIFYSNSNLSLFLRNRNRDSDTFYIKYKETRCGSLFIDSQKITLTYSRGLQGFKGLVLISNLDYQYNDGILELWIKQSRKKIIKARCDSQTYIRIREKYRTKQSA